MTTQFVIYCDESSAKGKYCSNFYGGGLLLEKNRIAIEDRLRNVKSKTQLNGELKWVKINTYNEECYTKMIDELFDIVEADLLKIRIMFTQNIHQIQHLGYDSDAQYFQLYYQFLKLAFGLKFCNPGATEQINVTVLLDKVPNSNEAFDNFKNYLSSLSTFPVFHRQRIIIGKENINDVDSQHHIILQMVDIVLGAMQFRLNLKHKEKPEGARVRGKKTRAKERIYKHINSRIRKIYPNFNIGSSTASPLPENKWSHPYRHWLFIPSDSVIDLNRAKSAERK